MRFTEQKKANILFGIAKQIKYSPKISIKQLSSNIGISRASGQKYVKELKEKGIIYKDKKSGWKLKMSNVFRRKIPNTGIDESDIYNKFIEQHVKLLHPECIKKFHYACTEMMNNVAEHSLGTILSIVFIEDYVSIQVRIIDNGVGIFKKIADGFHLKSLNDAVLELDKGKCTTDPDNHTGEGIFFSSKMFDMFIIQANGMSYVSKSSLDHSYLLENSKHTRLNGTCVIMELAKDNITPNSEIFERFCDDDKFNKTVVPVVHLIDRRNTTDMSLVARSQAKRLLARIDKFENVILDFDEIDSVGQAFADEIFRVYKRKHPGINISYINTNTEINRMISHVIKTAQFNESKGTQY